VLFAKHAKLFKEMAKSGEGMHGESSWILLFTIYIIYEIDVYENWYCWCVLLTRWISYNNISTSGDSLSIFGGK